MHVPQQDLSQVVRKATQGWGVDVIFEASGAPGAIKTLFQHLCPGGRVVFIGMPTAPVSFDIVAAQAKEARIETTFRYAHVYPRAIALLESGAIDVKPLISRTFGFADSVKAFDQALKAEPDTIKTQIVFQ